jgi:branched-subunit amino acid aminotransferase/4-amino-4-deoxychorismate lyase
MPEIKTTNYIRAVNLQSLMKEQGALEILYTHDDEVLECATSNFFLVKDNVLITPAEGVLEGITRKIVLELAEGDYKIERRKVAKADLGLADEIFITSSFKDIVPIVKIDDFAIGDGKVGPVTRDLMDKFAKYLA